MKSPRIYIAVLLLSLPALASAAGLVPCDGPDCQTCHIVTLVQKIIEFLIEFLTAASIIIFALGGLKMVMSAGDMGAIKTAKTMMSNAVVGLVILLTAWLIVDTTLKLLMREGTLLRPWHEIQCVPQPSGASSPEAGGGTTGDITAGSGTGTCTPATSGVCSPTSLQGSFGDASSQASQICMAESGGNPARLSAVDKLATGESFSVGLYQINLTVHELTGCGPNGTTLDCKSAFNGKNFSAKIVNRTLYNQCVSAAQNATCNINNAKKIYQSSNDTWRQWSTAKTCNL